MWYSVGPIVKSMSAVMQSQLEQNRKLEGDAIFNHSDGTQGKHLFLLPKITGIIALDIFQIGFFLIIAELTGNNSTMMTMMRFVVNYSPEIAEATMNMMQNATMVTMF